jgi:hypothetical protein
MLVGYKHQIVVLEKSTEELCKKASQRRTGNLRDWKFHFLLQVLLNLSPLSSSASVFWFWIHSSWQLLSLKFSSPDLLSAWASCTDIVEPNIYLDIALHNPESWLPEFFSEATNWLCASAKLVCGSSSFWDIIYLSKTPPWWLSKDHNNLVRKESLTGAEGENIKD